MLLATTEHVVLNVPAWNWYLLVAWFLVLITIDVVFFHRQDHIPTTASATLQTLFWIGMGCLLGGFIWLHYGSTAGGEYFSGFLIEKSLSLDNVFVWSIILTYFGIPRLYQHRVLFWGIMGAMIMRFGFIFAGSELLNRFEILLVLLGFLLIWNAKKIAFGGEDEAFDPENSRIVKGVRRFFPISKELDGHKLFTHENGKRVATMLFVALISLELIDVVFAIDSVPAALAVARDPFIVYGSNIAAILGLRALYFVFDSIQDKFWLLNRGVGVILAGVGIKMIIGPDELFGHQWLGIHVATPLSMGFIVGVLALSMVASLIFAAPADDMTHETTFGLLDAVDGKTADNTTAQG